MGDPSVELRKCFVCNKSWENAGQGETSPLINTDDTDRKIKSFNHPFDRLRAGYGHEGTQRIARIAEQPRSGKGKGAVLTVFPIQQLAHRLPTGLVRFIRVLALKGVHAVLCCKASRFQLR
jgi:hypothetical protein